MPITLYFETATSARWRYREPDTDKAQPRMTRLSYLLAEDFGEELDSYSALVKPDADWPPFEETAIVSTGIDRKFCEAVGTPLHEIMARFEGALLHANVACAYNTEFHWRVVRSSYGLLHDGMPMLKPAEVSDMCAMRYCTDVVRKPRMQPGGGYAWPTQREAYAYFAGSELPPASDHDPIERGMILVRATRLILENSRIAKDED
jgi:hypothetical protein